MEQVTVVTDNLAASGGVDWSFWIPLISIIILICLSGFFSGSETALTAASKARMFGLEKEGNKRAAMVNKIREHKDRMIGALLLGNNLVNILASALATSVFLKMVGEAGIVYATLTMTFIVLVFAEVLPKTYALKYSDSMAMAIAPIIRFVILIFSPITQMVTKIVALVLKVFGVDMESVSEDADEEELRGAIEMHSAGISNQNVQNADERKAMLRSILDLAEVEVGEIMTHRKNVVTIDIDTPLPEMIEAILDCPYTRIPMWKDNPDNVVGVIHAKQLLREVRSVEGNFDKLDVNKIALDPWFVPDTTSLFDQLQAFRERREHFSLVVDEYGSTMGIVTLEDILEEIVGEIDDEHDMNVPGVRAQADGSYLVEGQVTIRDLNRAFDWSLPDEHYSTLAGLILHEAKMIPEAGQAFSFYGFRFKIVKRLRHQISLIRLYPPVKEGEEAQVTAATLFDKSEAINAS
jgi:Mg2+/Co2+ transporter CorB